MALTAKGREAVEVGIWYGGAVLVVAGLLGGLAYASRGVVRLVSRRRKAARR